MHDLEMGDLHKDPEREREEGERHTTARRIGHSENPTENKRRGGERIEMVDSADKVGSCSVDHVVVPSSVGL